LVRHQMSRLLLRCPRSLSMHAVPFSRTKALPTRRRWLSAAAASQEQTVETQQRSTSESNSTKETEGKPVDPIQAKIKAKDDEINELTGRLRYAQADYLNMQRIAEREKEQTRDFAITRFASDLLETVDVLSLAIKSVPPTALVRDSSSPEHNPRLLELYTGVELTHRQLLATLSKYGVQQFDPTGEKFDPNRHEALYEAAADGKPPGTVIDCQKLGYLLKDRTLRAAQVGVSKEAAS